MKAIHSNGTITMTPGEFPEECCGCSMTFKLDFHRIAMCIGQKLCHKHPRCGFSYFSVQKEAQRLFNQELPPADEEVFVPISA